MVWPGVRKERLASLPEHERHFLVAELERETGAGLAIEPEEWNVLIPTAVLTSRFEARFLEALGQERDRLFLSRFAWPASEKLIGRESFHIGLDALGGDGGRRFRLSSGDDGDAGEKQEKEGRRHFAHGCFVVSMINSLTVGF